MNISSHQEDKAGSEAALAVSDEDEEDLICDAVQDEDPNKERRPDLSSFKGCIRCCCPMVIGTLNDLRKVNVAQVVSKKANSLSVEAVIASATNAASGGEPPELETVIERLDDIRKPLLDTQSYR